MPAQARFGIDPAKRPRGERRGGLGLMHPLALAVTVDTAGGPVNPALRRTPARHAAQQIARAGVTKTLARRWGQMHHAVGQTRQTAQCVGLIQVAPQGGDPLSAQTGHLVRRGGQGHHLKRLWHQAGQALAHIATTHDQQTLAAKPGR